MEKQSKKQGSLIAKVIRLAAGLPLSELIPELIGAARKLLRRRTPEGVYEVLDYECRLELLDRKGKRAAFPAVYPQGIKGQSSHLVSYPGREPDPNDHSYWTPRNAIFLPDNYWNQEIVLEMAYFGRGFPLPTQKLKLFFPKSAKKSTFRLTADTLL